MIKTIAIISMAAILAGCATTKDVVVIQEVEVKVPVRMPCPVTIPPRPDYMTHLLPLDASPRMEAIARASDRILSLSYEKDLEDKLAECVK